MIPCVIPHEIDPNRRGPFDRYARTRGRCAPRRNLIGHLTPHEGSMTTACGLCSSRADAEAVR